MIFLEWYWIISFILFNSVGLFILEKGEVPIKKWAITTLLSPVTCVAFIPLVLLEAYKGYKG